MIKKIATETTSHRRSFKFFSSARESWKSVLQNAKHTNPELKVLVPAYIGWSANEGSGIFDPIKDCNIRCSFYKMSRTLRVDFEDMKLKCDDNTLVLLVHYFGFVDPMYQEICAWLDGNSIKYIEDCAHALLSDFVGGVCGRKGLYSFYSLHKLLPLSGGGMLISNTLEHFQSSLSQYNDVWTFDLKLIFETRRKNYNQLLSLLSDVPNIEILYPELPDGISPQTLPILLPKKRDELYHAMNNIGFGMVSLYHTMIDMIPEDVFPDSHFTAQHIINFPVHQDITKQDLIEMTDQFKKLYR